MTTTEAKFSVTHRDARGDLWTARGDTYDEFVANHQAVAAYATEAGAVQSIERQLGPTTPVAPAAPYGQPPAAPPAFPPPAGVAPAASPPAPTCPHGPRIHKSGPTWEAWMCRARSDDPTRCQPLDAKTGKLWPKKG